MGPRPKNCEIYMLLQWIVLGTLFSFLGQAKDLESISKDQFRIAAAKAGKDSKNSAEKKDEMVGERSREKDQEDIGHFYFKLKRATTFYSNTITDFYDVDTALLDLGYRPGNYLGFFAKGALNPERRSSAWSVGNITEKTLKGWLVAFGPEVFLKTEWVTFSLGLGIGALTLTEESSFTPSGGSKTSSIITKTRFVTGPNFEMDINVIGGLFLTAGANYFVAFGNEPRPSFYTLMYGLGYSFDL